MTSKKQHIVHLVCAIAATGALVGAYFVGRAQGEAGDTGMRAEVEKLRKSEADAAIVTRVSQQMEEIAYQQKVISDQQRDRAEEQSDLAIKMRDQAEHEKVLARQAEENAVKSAQEASEQRQKAVEQQILAEEQRDQADLARRISDTLSYKALGRTLGYSAIVRQESSDTELAGLLAYASWHFLDKYKGNTYQSESFKALVSCSGMMRSYSLKKSGGVNAMCAFADGYAIVSDYGEIEIHKKDGSLVSTPVQNPDYEFKAALADGSTLYALSAHGPLVVCSATSQTNSIILPEDKYIGLFETGEGLCAIGKHSISVINKKSLSVMETQNIKDGILSFVKTENGTILFLESGKWNLYGADGALKDIHAAVSEPVTASCYDGRHLFLGHKHGVIDMVSKGEQVVSLHGHIGSVLDLEICENILVSSSYDKSILVWNLEQLEISGNESMQTPADLKLTDSWPLCLLGIDSNNIAAGFSDGQVFHTCISASEMANAILEKTTRNLTPEEWQLHIGASVPYETFK